MLDKAPLQDLVQMAESTEGRIRVVLEITERALATRPAELLRTVSRVRDLGWGVALDDVGAEAASLAFMSLLRPDVVKLDMSLVQGRPDHASAEIMGAVNAYAERTGALVLAEGVEDEGHLRRALGLGDRRPARTPPGTRSSRPSTACPRHRAAPGTEDAPDRD